MPRRIRPTKAFTLIELLVVVSIIAMLISILMPSLSRARDQSKGAYCLTRMHDFGVALAAYENVSQDQLPPALWNPGKCCVHGKDARYGWQEILFSYIYREAVYTNVDPTCGSSSNTAMPDFPAQRNLNPERFDNYFVCKASSVKGPNSGNYRVYLPFWAMGTFSVDSSGVYARAANPRASISRTSISPKRILLGDANERSERGDGDPPPQPIHEWDDSSYIDAGEANAAGESDGTRGNRFSDRHYGGTNYLYQDFHAAWNTKLRDQLARDWDQNNIVDIDDGD